MQQIIIHDIKTNNNNKKKIAKNLKKNVLHQPVNLTYVYAFHDISDWRKENIL